jgi:hypothetical protein
MQTQAGNREHREDAAAKHHYRVAEQCEHHGAEAHHPDVRPSQILSFNAHTETVVPLCYLHTSAQVFANIEHRPRWYTNSGVEPRVYTTLNRIASEMRLAPQILCRPLTGLIILSASFPSPYGAGLLLSRGLTPVLLLPAPRNA